MVDLMQRAGIGIWTSFDLWNVLAGAVAFVVLITGLKMRLLWPLLLVALVGACASLAWSEPPMANIAAWRWFSVPFALFPIAAGWQNRSPFLPLLVGIIGGGLSSFAFLQINAATSDVLLFPIVTIAIAYALYGLCRFMRPSAPEQPPASRAPGESV
jgi:hypothetical protein